MPIALGRGKDISVAASRLLDHLLDSILDLGDVGLDLLAFVVKLSQDALILVFLGGKRGELLVFYTEGRASQPCPAVPALILARVQDHLLACGLPDDALDELDYRLTIRVLEMRRVFQPGLVYVSVALIRPEMLHCSGAVGRQLGVVGHVVDRAVAEFPINDGQRAVRVPNDGVHGAERHLVALGVVNSQLLLLQNLVAVALCCCVEEVPAGLD